jgi:hypothetical protein
MPISIPSKGMDNYNSNVPPLQIIQQCNYLRENCCGNSTKKWNKFHNLTKTPTSRSRRATCNIEKVPHHVDMKPHIGFDTIKQNQIEDVDQYLPIVSDEVEVLILRYIFKKITSRSTSMEMALQKQGIGIASRVHNAQIVGISFVKYYYNVLVASP